MNADLRERVLAELRRPIPADAADPVEILVNRVMAAVAGNDTPRRGDAVEAWLKRNRDGHDDWPRWSVVDDLLDEYRLHAETGVPLDQHACDHAHCCDGEK